MKDLFNKGGIFFLEENVKRERLLSDNKVKNHNYFVWKFYFCIIVGQIILGVELK